MFGLLVIVVFSAAVFAVLHLTRSEQPPTTTPETRRKDTPATDPRLTYDTPYRNVKPGVKYVGDAACETCHAGICKTYHAHPMGRSAGSVVGTPAIEKFPASGPASAHSGPFELVVEKTAGGATHRVKLREPGGAKASEVEMPVQVVIGSGTRGRSYLTVADGFVSQSPVSWYSPDERWGLSPGFDIGRSVTWPVDTPCLYCHTGVVEQIPGTENRFREPLFAGQAAIGCERCHGPGELHVADRSRDLNPAIPDTSIVNPRHLSQSLQLAVCEQCHLQGKVRVVRRGRNLFDYRPGLPFELFASVFVRPPDAADANDSVGQFEQMEQSRCFTRSGRLTCTSCHDPHAVPTAADRDAHYRQRCQTCHQGPGQKACASPAADRQAKGDSCVACHMPKAPSTSIVHASVTNHRVPRTSAPIARQPDPFASAPLVRFRPSVGLPRGEQDRDFAIALAEYGGPAIPDDPGVRGAFRVFAVTPLKAAVARAPEDTDAWVALVRAQVAVGEAVEALKSARSAVRSAGESELTLTVLTEAAAAAGEHQLAVDTAGKWAALNPRSTDPLFQRAAAHFNRQDWAKSEADWRAVLKINPFLVKARLHLAVCLHRRGDAAGAGEEVQAAAKLEPDAAAQERMMTWYRQAIR